MKFVSGKYPEAEPAKYARFKYPEQAGVEPTFLRRFAALCRDLGVVGVIPAGYRTVECQKETIKLVLSTTPGSYLKKGAVYNKAGKCIASAPGKSNHNYRIALDCESEKVKVQPDSVLTKYGLRSPMDHEPWHFEPIEVIGMSMADKVAILNSYKEEILVDVKIIQTALKAVNLYDGPIDNISGKKTEAGIKTILPKMMELVGMADAAKVLQDKLDKIKTIANS